MFSSSSLDVVLVFVVVVFVIIFGGDEDDNGRVELGQAGRRSVAKKIHSSLLAYSHIWERMVLFEAHLSYTARTRAVTSKIVSIDGDMQGTAARF